MNRKTIALLCSVAITLSCVLPVSAAQRVETRMARRPATPSGFFQIVVETDTGALKYYSQFPNPVEQLLKDFGDGSVLNQFPDMEVILHGGMILKDIMVESDRNNQEAGQVLRQTVPDSQKTSGEHCNIKNMDVLRTTLDPKTILTKDILGTFELTPLFFLKMGDGSLHLICSTTNALGKEIAFRGIQELEITSNGKEFAHVYPQLLEKPFVYSSLPSDGKAYASNMVIDGYPTGSFLDIVLPKGTYDDSRPVSELNDVGIAFDPVYDVIS